MSDEGEQETVEALVLHEQVASQDEPSEEQTGDIPISDESALGAAPRVEIKLFVGRVPRTWGAEELQPVFEEFGRVVEVAIIRDKGTRMHKGSAFVRMSSVFEGDLACRELDGRRCLESSLGNMQVKYAQGELSRLGMESVGETTNSSVKLFVGSIPRTAVEKNISDLFGKYGRVEDVYILRNNQTNESKGCCFVKFAYKEQAIYSIQQLDGKHTMEGCIRALEVRFAQNKFIQAGARDHHEAPMRHPQYPPVPSRMVWKEYFTADGRPYYHNEETNATTWERPVEMCYSQHMPMAPPPPHEDLCTPVGSGPPGANLFVFHVPNEWRRIDLIKTFSACGTLAGARIATDKNTGRNRGFAFVGYKTKESAAEAIRTINGLLCHGKRLKVSPKKGEEPYLKPLLQQRGILPPDEGAEWNTETGRPTWASNGGEQAQRWNGNGQYGVVNGTQMYPQEGLVIDGMRYPGNMMHQSEAPPVNSMNQPMTPSMAPSMNQSMASGGTTSLTGPLTIHAQDPQYGQYMSPKMPTEYNQYKQPVMARQCHQNLPVNRYPAMGVQNQAPSVSQTASASSGSSWGHPMNVPVVHAQSSQVSNSGAYAQNPYASQPARQ